MSECPNIEPNRQTCTCKNETCERHGQCCACVAFHRDRGELPACLRNLAS